MRYDKYDSMMLRILLHFYDGRKMSINKMSFYNRYIITSLFAIKWTKNIVGSSFTKENRIQMNIRASVNTNKTFTLLVAAKEEKIH